MWPIVYKLTIIVKQHGATILQAALAVRELYANWKRARADRKAPKEKPQDETLPPG